MTVQIRGTSTNTSSSNTTLTVNVPTGTLDGDLMLFQVGRATATAGQLLLAGWKEIPRAYQSGVNSIRMYYREASSEPASYTFTINQATSIFGGIISLYSDTAAPLKIVDYVPQSNATSTNRQFASVTLPTSGIHLCFGIIGPNSSTPSAGYTEQWDISFVAGRGYLQTIPNFLGSTGVVNATGTTQPSQTVSMAVVEGVMGVYPGPLFITSAVRVLGSHATPDTFTLPTGILDNDLLIWQVTTGTTDFTPTMPAGWVACPNGSQTGTGANGLYTFYKIASSEPATYNVTYTGTKTLGHGFLVIRSNRGWPLSITSGASQTNASSVTRTYPSVSPVYPDSMLVIIQDLIASLLVSVDTGTFLAERYDSSNAQGSIASLTEYIALSGPTGTRTTTGTATVSKVVSLAVEEIEPTPITPTDLEATAVSTVRIDLTWSDNDSYERGTSIERSTDGFSDWAEIATVAANVESYSDSTCDADTTYYYRVRQFVVTTYSLYSGTDSATTFDGIRRPNHVEATAIHPHKVFITWSDPNLEEDGTAIERSINGTDFTEIATVAADVVSYLDDTVDDDTHYYYRLRAFTL